MTLKTTLLLIKLLARSVFTGFRYDGMTKLQTIKSDIQFARAISTQ